MTIDTILLIIAAVCFVLVALDVQIPRLNPLGLGLFCWVLTALV